MTSQWPDSCDAITWIMISNSLGIDFIHGYIYGRSCKKRQNPLSQKKLLIFRQVRCLSLGSPVKNDLYSKTTGKMRCTNKTLIVGMLLLFDHISNHIHDYRFFLASTVLMVHIHIVFQFTVSVRAWMTTKVSAARRRFYYVIITHLCLSGAAICHQNSLLILIHTFWLDYTVSMLLQQLCWQWLSSLMA